MARPSTMTLLGIAILMAWSRVAGAVDAQSGKKLSDESCGACHGQNGIGIIPLYPNLAGQKREHLAAQLRAFRDGSRKNPIMGPMAVHLSDSNIDDVSGFTSHR